MVQGRVAGPVHGFLLECSTLPPIFPSWFQMEKDHKLRKLATLDGGEGNEVGEGSAILSASHPSSLPWGKAASKEVILPHLDVFKMEISQR